MKVKQWLVLNKNGIHGVRKTKPSLGWNEIAMQIELNVPNEYRPTISAKFDIKDVPLMEFNPQVIIDTKDLVEQQTGAKIEFTVVYQKDTVDE
jgi:hypothetical protein